MLSLHGFGGMRVQLYETYFAAKVKTFDTVFDQVFFVVNKAVHPVLLGLPAMMAARVHLLTVAGCDMMPEMNKALMLSFTPTWHQQKAAQMLNYLVDLMKQQPGEMDQSRAWQTLGLGDFGLQQVNLLMELLPQSTLHNQILEVVEDDDLDEPPGLEPVPADEVEMNEVPNLEMPIHEPQFRPMIWT